MAESRIFNTIAGDEKHPLEVADVEIPAYVLDDENQSRVLTQRGMFNALSIVRGDLDSGGDEIDYGYYDIPNTSPFRVNSGVALVRFIERKWLKPYISDRLRVGLKTPITIRTPGGLGKAYHAEALPLLCSAITKAHRNGATTSRQKYIVERAYLISEALGIVGITSLVDEATGFQKIREERALAEILEKFIEEELRLWTKRFSDEYYIQLHRLWPTEASMKSTNHPQFFGTLTNKLIYDQLAPGVLNRLRELNPISPSGHRQAKHHQHLSTDFGVIALDKHLQIIITLMRISGSKDSFLRSFNEAFVSRQMKLPFDENTNEM